MLKKLIPTIALAILSANLQAADQKLVIGASPIPHAEILEVVAPLLKKEGVELEIKEFSDYVLPNTAVEEKQLDANYFQHQPYLSSFNADHKTTITAVPNSNVHVEPFGAYSKKIKNINDLKEGALVAIPNDPSNSGRALLLLDKAGLIKLKDNSKITATEADIAENPKKLQFKELEAAILPRSLEDVDLALINTNYALEAGLVPTKDALLLEDRDSIYANFIATRADKVDDPTIKKLVTALHSPEVKAFIQTKYKGAIIPAF